MAGSNTMTVRLTDRSFIQRMGNAIQIMDARMAQRLIDGGKAVLEGNQPLQARRDTMIRQAPVNKGEVTPWEGVIFPQEIIAAVG